jgi:TPR repeat protein
MSQYPPEVQQFHDALCEVPGVRSVGLEIRGLEGLDERMLSLPGDFGDLPHLALQRTKGGLPNETLVTAKVRFTQDQKGWVAVEFLAWWVRDLSRSGTLVQMRPLALPPRAYGTQLGRTLTFAIEFFFVNEGEDNGPILKKLAEHADWVRENLRDYAKEIANPTEYDQSTLEALRRCAEAGDAQAEYQLALRFDRGDGVPRDLEAAFGWFKRSAEHNSPYGFLAVGHCYFAGRGVGKDDAAAFENYRKAAEAGLSHGQYRAALCYKQGTGTQQGPRQAAEFFRRAAEQGHRDAMRELGHCLAGGNGVDEDLAGAFQWYQRAADAGDPMAMGCVGECFTEGRGTEKDVARGVDWYRRGAEAEDIGCQAQYGDCFLNGVGVEQDLRQALHWFQRALDQGFDPVAEVVADLKRRLGEAE